MCLIVYVSKYGLERDARSLSRAAHHLFSYTFLGLSDTEAVKYRNMHLLHLIWYGYVYIFKIYTGITYNALSRQSMHCDKT